MESQGGHELDGSIHRQGYVYFVLSYGQLVRRVSVLFTGYPYVTEGEMMSGDPLAAADWLRIAFHESGQFMWNGERGSGDDGSFW